MKFYFLFALVIIIAIATPHVVRGHILIPERYAESAIITLDILLAYIFYIIYKRDLKKLNKAKETVENNLIASYKHIGKTNLEIDIFNRFINSLTTGKTQTDTEKKDIFKDLLATMVGSIAQSRKGLVRFIDKNNKKTVKEFYYHEEGDQFNVKLPNNVILDEANQPIDNNEISILISDYNNSDIICIFCYANNKDKINYKLLKTLLNQFHLLFLVSNSKTCTFN